MLAKIFITVFAASLSMFAIAGEHPLGSIKGTDIDLKSYDHAIAGSIKDFVIWGSVDEASFTSELKMRRDGQVVTTLFKKDGDKVGGVIAHEVDEVLKSTSLTLESFDKETNTYRLTANGVPFKVSIEADDFVEGHFINPTYTAALADGSQVRFAMEGHACYGYSLHLIFLIMGAYLH